MLVATAPILMVVFCSNFSTGQTLYPHGVSFNCDFSNSVADCLMAKALPLPHNTILHLARHTPFTLQAPALLGTSQLMHLNNMGEKTLISGYSLEGHSSKSFSPITLAPRCRWQWQDVCRTVRDILWMHLTSWWELPSKGKPLGTDQPPTGQVSTLQLPLIHYPLT